MKVCSQKTIFVIDDNQIHLHAFESILVKMEWQLVACDVVENAIQTDENPDLVLLNMDTAKQCSNLILHKVLNGIPTIQVMCYSARNHQKGVST